jgi:predicted nucleotidyltransferase
MKPSEVFSQHRETIRQIVLESGMTNPRLFGSALHGDDTDGSDLDILVDQAPDTSIFDLVDLQLALEERLGTKVDVRLPGELHRAFRDSVLAEAISI